MTSFDLDEELASNVVMIPASDSDWDFNESKLSI